MNLETSFHSILFKFIALVFQRDNTIVSVYCFRFIMNSYKNQCTDVKRYYDDCFHTWFIQKFLKGEVDSDPCSSEFEVYQQCLKVCN